MALIILSNVGPWDCGQVGIIETCDSTKSFVRYITSLNLPAPKWITRNVEEEVYAWSQDCDMKLYPYRGAAVCGVQIEVNPLATDMYFIVDTEL